MPRERLNAFRGFVGDAPFTFNLVNKSLLWNGNMYKCTGIKIKKNNKVISSLTDDEKYSCVYSVLDEAETKNYSVFRLNPKFYIHMCAVISPCDSDVFYAFLFGDEAGDLWEYEVVLCFGPHPDFKNRRRPVPV